jgi:hypothetical protein
MSGRTPILPLGIPGGRTGFRPGAACPFNFTRSKYSESLSPGGLCQRNGRVGLRLPVRFFSETGNGTLYDTRYSLTYNRLIKTAPRDVLPRWGQSLSLYFRHTPFRGDYSGQIFTAQADCCCRAWGGTSGLWLRGGYQQEDVRRDRRVTAFPTTLLFPRGFATRVSRIS